MLWRIRFRPVFAMVALFVSLAAQAQAVPAVRFGHEVEGYVGFTQTREGNGFGPDFGPVERMGEAGFGNSSMNAPMLGGGVRRQQEPFVTLGPASHSRVGVEVPVGIHVSIGASVSDVLPLGTQKLYTSVL